MTTPRMRPKLDYATPEKRRRLGGWWIAALWLYCIGMVAIVLYGVFWFWAISHVPI